MTYRAEEHAGRPGGPRREPPRHIDSDGVAYRVRRYNHEEAAWARKFLSGLDGGPGPWFVEYWSKVWEEWMPYSQHTTQETAVRKVHYLHWLRSRIKKPTKEE